MSREFYGDLAKTTYQEKLTPLLIPIALSVPDTIADRMTKRELRNIRGVFLFRFFPKMPPQIGDTLTRNGHRWLIVGREFPDLQVNYSPKKDQIPTIATEYLGEV